MQSARVRTYFETHCRQFDRLYDETIGLNWLLNRGLRRPFYRRFDLTMLACGDVQGKRILDVGCGSGRYSVALAERGAEVVGVDFASNMIDMARALAEERGVDQKCRFIQSDFLGYDFGETFDISLAIGLFDYVAEPEEFLQKLHSSTREKVIVTFPPPGGWRASLRKLRYQLQNCPVYFHTRESMAARFDASGFESWDVRQAWAVAIP